MGKLIIVGSGVKSLSHITEETKVVISSADHCLYLVTEKNLKDWIESVSKASSSLEFIFDTSITRAEVYRNVTEYILEQAEQYSVLCVVFYGHPIFFANSTLTAAQEHRARGGDAIILPSISSIDTLWADLSVDPGGEGCSVYDATDFLISKRVFDIRSHLVLLQVGVIGSNDFELKDRLGLLQDYLEEFYPKNHLVILYESSVLPGTKPYIQSVNVSDLHKVNASKVSTLYIPPYEKTVYDRAMVEKILKASS